MGSALIKPSKRGTRPDRLTSKQLIFVEEYLADSEMNGARAARKAGYIDHNSTATKLLNNPKVAHAIGKAIRDRMMECKLEAADVLRHLRTALYLDPLDLFESGEDGSYKVRNLEDIPIEVRRCITEIESKTTIDRHGNMLPYLKIKLMSKDSALSSAMKHLGLVEPDGAVNINLGASLIDDMLEQVENERLVIDGKVIEREAESGK